jgi:hypothetical protein
MEFLLSREERAPFFNTHRFQVLCLPELLKDSGGLMVGAPLNHGW